MVVQFSIILDLPETASLLEMGDFALRKRLFQPDTPLALSHFSEVP